MASRNNKRKTRPYDDPHPPPKQPDSSLFIHAYEADLIRGPQAWDAARSLEVFSEGSGRAVVGDGLIQWSGRQGLGFDDMGDEEHIRLGSGSVPTPKAAQDGGSGVWMDRYAHPRVSWDPIYVGFVTIVRCVLLSGDGAVVGRFMGFV